MPENQPTPAQRVARTLQHAHARAVTAREDAQRQLSHLTHQHERAAAALHDAHAEEQALAAALAERGAPTLAEVNEERRARELAEFERLTAERAAPSLWSAGALARLAGDGSAAAEEERKQARPMPGDEPEHLQALAELARERQQQGGRRDLQPGRVPLDLDRPRTRADDDRRR